MIVLWSFDSFVSSLIMTSLGYSPPHRCRHCDDLYLNFNSGRPWEKLKYLHQRMEIWPAAWVREAPEWILPQYFPQIGPHSIEPFKQYLPSGSSSLNGFYRRELEKNPALLEEATRKAGRYSFLDYNREQCKQLANQGCMFFTKILEGDKRKDAPKLQEMVQSSHFIIAVTERWDGLVFGIPVFGRHFRYGIDIQPLLTFDVLAPVGRHPISILIVIEISCCC